jgi:hypothetical protein
MNETEEKPTAPAGSETQKKPRKKMRLWKKILLGLLAVHLLFTAIDALWLHGPGVSGVIQYLGETQLTVSDLRYRIEPETNELVITWTESFDTSILPAPVFSLRGWPIIHEKTEKCERRIALDPLPEELVQCFVDVTVTPDASPPRMMPPLAGALVDLGPRLVEEHAVLAEPLEFNAGQLNDLPPDMVFRLTLRPEDVPLLSDMFVMTPKLGEYSSFLIMIPQPGEQDGRRVMFLSRRGAGGATPYYEDLCVKWRQEMEDLSREPDGFLTVCWKILWLPLAALPDWIWGAYGLFILFMLSRVDW